MGKHRIRKTGEIIEVVSFNGTTQRDKTDSVSYIDSKGVEHENKPLNFYWDLEHIDNYDMERGLYAAMAMKGILSNEEEVEYAVSNVCYEGDEIHTIPKAIAQYAVACADALIKELSKEVNQ